MLIAALPMFPAASYAHADKVCSPFPAVLVSNGEARVIRRRETLDDVLALES